MKPATVYQNAAPLLPFFSGRCRNHDRRECRTRPHPQCHVVKKLYKDRNGQQNHGRNLATIPNILLHNFRVREHDEHTHCHPFQIFHSVAPDNEVHDGHENGQRHGGDY